MNQIKRLTDCWCEKGNLFLQYFTANELFKFASSSQDNLKCTQNYMKEIAAAYKNKKYGFKINEAGYVEYTTPHDKCLIKVWGDERHGFMDFIGYPRVRPFFGGPSFKFAHNAIVQLTNIINKGHGNVLIYGWIISGSQLPMMTNKGKKYFRKCPFWSYITPSNLERFKFIPIRAN